MSRTIRGHTSKSVVRRPNEPVWTVEVPFSAIMLFKEVIFASFLALVAAILIACVMPEALGLGLLGIGVFLAVYSGRQAFKSYTWLSSGRLILAANEDVLQVSDPTRKHDPPREVAWSNVSGINIETVTTTHRDSDTHREIQTSTEYLNFDQKVITHGRPIMIALSNLDRPVHVLVAELRARTGARNVSNIDPYLLER